MPGGYVVKTRTTYIEPTPENITGFIQEEAVKQLSGFKQRNFMQVGLPSVRGLAQMVVFLNSPLAIQETIEDVEPQPISYASVSSRENIPTPFG